MKLLTVSSHRGRHTYKDRELGSCLSKLYVLQMRNWGALAVTNTNTNINTAGDACKNG